MVDIYSNWTYNFINNKDKLKGDVGMRQITREELMNLRKKDDKLLQDVIDDILDMNESDEEITDYCYNVYEHGGVSGAIPSLIYHRDCETFAKKHLETILEILNNDMDEGIGLPPVLSMDTLAWLGYERVIYYIVNRY